MAGRKGNPEVNRRIATSALVTLAFSVTGFYLGNRYFEALASYPGQFLDHCGDALLTMWPRIHENPFYLAMDTKALLVGFCMLLVVWMVWLRHVVYIGNYRSGEESGSARWGTVKEGKRFRDLSNPDNNLIFTEKYGLALHRPKYDPELDRNLNVLVVGGSGSGKTFNYVTPDICQLNTNYFITDPKGTLINEVGTALLRKGYRIKILNTINFKKSMRYNPFSYIHDEKDILKLVTTLITNTKGDGKGTDDFWVKAETLLYAALIGYIHYEAPEEEQNFATLLEMLNAMEIREDDEEFKNPVDLMFDELEKKDPDHFAVRQYKKYKLSAGKTAKSINVSAGARLAPFDIKELREITSYDELELDMLGDRKTALFLIMSDTDATFNFLISMVYS